MAMNVHVCTIGAVAYDGVIAHRNSPAPDRRQRKKLSKEDVRSAASRRQEHKGILYGARSGVVVRPRYIVIHNHLQVRNIHPMINYFDYFLC